LRLPGWEKLKLSRGNFPRPLKTSRFQISITGVVLMKSCDSIS